MFNPVTKMKLVELVFPAAASEETRSRALALCEAFEKTPVEVPDVPGFVVNRLLFPYLFSAVVLLEETGMDAESVDTCMRLGAGHPMGPLALLDLVGLDVSKAIGETIGAAIPARMEQLIDEQALGTQERPRLSRLLSRLRSLARSRAAPLGRDRKSDRENPLRFLLAGVHADGDTATSDIKSHCTPASSQCTRPVRTPRGPDVFNGRLARARRRVAAGDAQAAASADSRRSAPGGARGCARPRCGCRAPTRRESRSRWR